MDNNILYASGKSSYHRQVVDSPVMFSAMAAQANQKDFSAPPIFVVSTPRLASTALLHHQRLQDLQNSHNKYTFQMLQLRQKRCVLFFVVQKEIKALSTRIAGGLMPSVAKICELRASRSQRLMFGCERGQRDSEEGRSFDLQGSRETSGSGS